MKSLFAKILPAVVFSGLFAARLNAVVIYTDNPDLTVTPINGDQDYIAFGWFSQQVAFNNPVGGLTAVLYHGFGGSELINLLLDADRVLGPSNYAAKLPLGTVIDGSLTFGPGADGYLEPEWDGGGEGIVGFRTFGGNYGWIHLSYDDAANTTTLLEFAVESDPGVALATPVPEPATFALFSTGAMAMLLRRRRAS